MVLNLSTDYLQQVDNGWGLEMLEVEFFFQVCTIITQASPSIFQLN
jgi:hypothetical protein